ncbi:MAG: 50S ribosomal protein L4 [Bacteroidia bacterium]|jgi:large subunit ribosomal protein L4|nr:50S ribosomal protein L4 [Bacteroidia bacterium]MCO5254058.1 50S ribosomal protein L4 [Bacteroidota bacterium]MCZ2131473.1 50S ribosomal protein L4 [Bacteroidia bacterium]
MEAKVYNSKGEFAGRTVSLPNEIFGIEPNDHAIYLDVKLFLANQRQGTHKAKEKSEVAYSTKKLKRQKGTGGARAGSRKSGTIVGGGRIHGPRPRNYGFKLNTKLKNLARLSALAYKAKEDKVIIIEDLAFDKPNTASFANLLKNMQIDGSRTLFLVDKSDKNVVLSGRNIPNNKIGQANSLNTYEIMNSNNLILTESSIQIINETYKK